MSKSISFFFISIVTGFLFNTVSLSANNKVDSIINLIKSNEISLSNKYALRENISDLRTKDQIRITKELINQIKVDKNKDKLISLYCDVSVFYQSINDPDKGKAYLDSAFQYIDTSLNNNTNAELCCLIGNYFFNKKEESKAFEFYRKGLKYCAKSKGTEIAKLKILHRISAFYYLKMDKVSLKKYMDEMLQEANKDKSDEAYFITYPICAVYYRMICNDPKTSDEDYYQYLDSVYFYDKKVVDIYESGDNKLKKKQAATMAKYYMSYAEIMVVKNSSDWKNAIEAIDKSTDILSPTDTMALIRNRHVKSRIFFNIKKYEQSISESLKSLEILNHYTGEKYSGYYDIYSVLVDSYSAQKDFENALKYERLRSDVIKNMNEISKYEAVKDIETRYETAEKKLEISRLNEEKQKTQTKMSLIVSVGILSILSLFVALLYNRIKRLKKEQEAAILSAKIKEKEIETQAILKKAELKQMRHYLDGLEVERNRLSKDLHDVVANKLFILDKNLKNIEDIPDSIFLQVEELYTQTRDISHNLISPSFKYTSLQEIIFNFIEDAKESTNIDFHLNITDKLYCDNLPMHISHEIYRIIQELVSNIIKHSSSKNTWISLSYKNNILTLEIKDDGIGFDVQKRKRGIGLQIIQNRCTSLDAHLTIESAQGNGSRIIVTFPSIQPNADELQ